MDFRQFVNAKAIELNKDVLRMTTGAGSGHPSSGLSIMHIVVTLMHDVMRWDPADPWHAGNDRLVLSEGHAVPAIYAAYADLGGVVGRDRRSAKVLSKADLASLREADSPLDGHPNPAEGFPFFDAATGSLGQGLSVGAGLALAARQRRIDKQIYVLLGDGESREGQVWEAMDLIADYGLTNVVAIFSCNGQGQADYVSKQQSPDMLAAKAGAFGWQAVILDGHDPDAIRAALAEPEKRALPLAVIAKTVKGWGCDALKDKSNHGKPVPANRLDAAIAELDGMYDTLGIRAFACGTAVSAVEGGTRGGRPCHTDGVGGTRAARPEHNHSFETAVKNAGLAGQLEHGKLATRRAYGAALLAIGSANERVIALDGDVRNSTMSEIFATRHPDRFVECKIAEQNMISVAVGLAASGAIPFVSTFAKFTARAYDQIEMAQIGRANIKITGSHAGISLAADGPSQMSLHDVAYFRSASETDNGFGQPVCVSFHPCDAVAAYHCTWLMAAHRGMCYMRTHRPDVPLIYPLDAPSIDSPDAIFRVGGSNVLQTGDAVTVVTAGYMVHVCKEAVGILAASGVHCTLIDAYSFPLDGEPILAAASKTGNRILCVEDNYVGGLGGAVAEAAAATGGVTVQSMTCRRIPKSAKTPAEMMAYAGLAPSDIAAKVREMLGKD
ncbi:MAG: transketolase [Phycisphaerae bacterium]|nr:transketolase [Phycisphaerae bacterium]